MPTHLAAGCRLPGLPPAAHDPLASLPPPPPPPWPLQVNGRYIKKRIHVRIEHVSPSRCHEEFLRRCKENDEARHAAKVAGTPAPPCKRVPKGPRTTGFTLENVAMETITAVPYDILKVRKNGRDGGGVVQNPCLAYLPAG